LSLSGDGAKAELVGTAKEVIGSLGRALPLVLLAFIVMYLTLGILYESLGHPITVLASLPSALLGGLAGLWILDSELDIYGFFGLLMLLGIVKKNAIMLVDFARQRQREGVGAREAILEASMERLRPIQLTTLAAAAGAIPMLIGTGSGISVLKPVGAILLGGLLVSQVVTLALTPPLYRLVEGFSHRAGRLFHWGAK
jgi:multidrug efflux pump subunit AcrB